MTSQRLGRLLIKASRSADIDEEDSAFVTPIIVRDDKKTCFRGSSKHGSGAALSQSLGGWYETEPSI